MTPQYSPPISEPEPGSFLWVFEKIGEFISRFCSSLADMVKKAWQCTWGDSGKLNVKNTQWNDISGKIKGASSNLQGEAYRNVQGAWKGSAATAFSGYILTLSKNLDRLGDLCANIAKGLATAASEVVKLRVAIITITLATIAFIVTMICAAAGTFGMTLAAIPPAIIAWGVAVGAIIGVYVLFFNSMDQAFNDVEGIFTELEKMDTKGVAPAPPQVALATEGWDING